MRPSHSFHALLLSFSALLACTVLSWPANAHGGVPDPANSEVPLCLTACPAGDLVTVIVVRDFNNVPIENSLVVIDFSICQGFTICPPAKSDPYIWDDVSRTVRALTDATGAVRFPLRAGGVCGTSVVEVFADGVFLADRTLASPDQDGNLSVNPADQAIANPKLGMSDPTADFDCNGTVTAADLFVVQSHQRHDCTGPTPARPRSWGSIKLIYR